VLAEVAKLVAAVFWAIAAVFIFEELDRRRALLGLVLLLFIYNNMVEIKLF